MAKKESEDSPKLTFEQAQAQLEKIVNDIEQGRIPLEQSIEKYEQGMKLIKHCRTILEQAEKKIETISQEMQSDSERSS